MQSAGLVQYLPGKKAGYYAGAVGGYSRMADVRRAPIKRANGLVMKANRRFWFDRTVPPAATIVVPERGPGRSLWRQQRVVGFAVRAVLASLGRYASAVTRPTWRWDAARSAARWRRRLFPSATLFLTMGYDRLSCRLVYGYPFGKLLPYSRVSPITQVSIK